MMRTRTRRPVAVTDEVTSVRARLGIAVLVMGAVHLVGTVGYYLLGRIYLAAGEAWSLVDCYYMTVITVTTVGFGEYLDVHAVPGGWAFTAAIIVLGGVVEIYAVSILTTFLLEGHLLHVRQTYRMRKTIEAMKDHVILCGTGRSGIHVAGELIETGHPFVAIDVDRGRLDDILALGGERENVGALEGDATQRETLLEAGIERARAVIVTLADDKETVFTAMLARDLNSEVHIVAKASDGKVRPLMHKAGANRVVATKEISGMRLASEAIRPNVVDFLSEMVSENSDTVRFEEVHIVEHGPFDGKPLRALRLGGDHVFSIVALRRSGDGPYEYGPSDETTLCAGDIVIIVGGRHAIEALRKVTIT